MVKLEGNTITFRSDEPGPDVAVEVLDVDGTPRLIPVFDPRFGYSITRDPMHVDRGVIQVGRLVLIDHDTDQRFVVGAAGWAEYDPATHPGRGYLRTMEISG